MLPTPPLRLITISVSHYVEKVKWALEIAGISYKEESVLPGLHALVTLWHTRGSHRSTPVLIDGTEVVPDSTQILLRLAARYGQAWLYPASALEFEEQFDERIGPHTRRYIYRVLFENGYQPGVIFDQPVTPSWQRALLPVLAPAMKQAMISDMKINPAEAERSRQVFEAEFDFVAGLLRDGRPFLCGERISAADITFAALSAPVLLPPEYGARLPSLHELPRENPVRQMVERYRQTTAGRFAMQLYARYRKPHSGAENY